MSLRIATMLLAFWLRDEWATPYGLDILIPPVCLSPLERIDGARSSVIRIVRPSEPDVVAPFREHPLPTCRCTTASLLPGACVCFSCRCATFATHVLRAWVSGSPRGDRFW